MSHSRKHDRSIYRPSQITTNRLGRILLTAVGTLSVALGVVGMLLPLLPTTPFLLLAAACYARSSPRFYHWLMTNRWCGAYIRNYREGRGLPLRQKIMTLALLWVSMGTTAVFIVPLWWVRLLLLVIASGVTFHLLRIPTFKAETTTPPDAVLPASSKERKILFLMILIPFISPSAYGADEPMLPDNDEHQLAEQQLVGEADTPSLLRYTPKSYLALISPLAGYNRNKMIARGGPQGRQPVKQTENAPIYGLFLLLGNPRFVVNDYFFYTKPNDTDVLGNLFYLNVYGDPEATVTWNLGAGHLYHKIKPSNEDIEVNVPMLKAGPIIRIKPWGITLNPYLGYAWERIETHRGSVSNDGMLYGLSVDWRWRMINLNVKYYYQDGHGGDENYNAVRARFVMGFNQHWGMSMRYDYMEQMTGDNASWMVGPVYVF